jgi:hypothetical protein
VADERHPGGDLVTLFRATVTQVSPLKVRPHGGGSAVYADKAWPGYCGVGDVVYCDDVAGFAVAAIHNVSRPTAVPSGAFTRAANLTVPTGAVTTWGANTAGTMPGTSDPVPQIKLGDVVGGAFTLYTPGLYGWELSVTWPASSQTSAYRLEGGVQVNGVSQDDRTDTFIPPSTAQACAATYTGTVRGAIGDTVRPQLWQNSGASLSVAINSCTLYRIGD